MTCPPRGDQLDGKSQAQAVSPEGRGHWGLALPPQVTRGDLQEENRKPRNMATTPRMWQEPPGPMPGGDSGRCVVSTHLDVRPWKPTASATTWSWPSLRPVASRNRALPAGTTLPLRAWWPPFTSITPHPHPTDPVALLKALRDSRWLHGECGSSGLRLGTPSAWASMSLGASRPLRPNPSTVQSPRKSQVRP